MTGRAKVRARALAAIPDAPATVETRALALDDATYVHAIGAGWLLIAGNGDLACVFGDVDPVTVDTILDVAGFDGDLLVPGTDALTVAALAGRWSVERALIFTTSSATHRSVAVAASPGQALVDVRPLSLQDALGHVPADLRDEIGRAVTTREIFATFCEDAPVSFAYVSLETERHGDLSVDTLDAFRRRGFGAAALRPAIADLLARGKRPVWGAIENNAASLALARRLGITAPAGTLYVATRLGSGR